MQVGCFLGFRYFKMNSKPAGSQCDCFRIVTNDLNVFIRLELLTAIVYKARTTHRHFRLPVPHPRSGIYHPAPDTPVPENTLPSTYVE